MAGCEAGAAGGVSGVLLAASAVRIAVASFTGSPCPPMCTVTLDGVTIKPALALGGWTAFKPMHGGAMVMGDLVLLETEINPVMAKLIENGLEITAVHNHVLRANPLTFYMHIGGHGDPVKLATAIRTGLAASKTPLTPPAAPA